MKKKKAFDYIATIVILLVVVSLIMTTFIFASSY